MKEQLTELIEAYAVAKATGNTTLQQLATQQLSTFLEAIEINESAPEAAPEPEPESD